MLSRDTDPVASSRSPVETMYARDLTCQALGIVLDDVGPGRAKLRMRLGETMVNGHGIAHGGYLFLLADAAFAYASNSHGRFAVAQSAQVTYLRPASAGDELTADAIERDRSGRLGVYDVTVRRGETIIAEFRGQSVAIAGSQNRKADQ